MKSFLAGTLAAVTLYSTTPTALAMDVDALSPTVPTIDRIVDLPITGLRAVESDGKLHLISQNGRFVITGHLVDVWNRQSLDSLEQIEALSDRIVFKQMGLDIDTLNSVSVGKGSQEVVVFVDPQCGPCHELMSEAKQLAESDDRYTFKFVAVPALGDESHALAKTLFCAKDRNQRLTALMAGTLAQLETVADCNVRQYDVTLVTAQMVGVNGVPFVVAPDGRIARGRPTNLVAFLEGRP